VNVVVDSYKVQIHQVRRTEGQEAL